MADIRISQLTELETAPADSDVLIINDVSVNTTKKITFTNLLSNFAENVIDSASGARCTGDFVIDNELILGGDLTTTAAINAGSLTIDQINTSANLLTIGTGLGTNDTLKVGEIDINQMGNLDGSGITLVSNLKAEDNTEFRVGDAGDGKFYHDGSDTYIEDAGTGSLLASANSGILLKNKVSGKNYISMTRSGNKGGQVRLWYQDDENDDGFHDGEHYSKLETYDSGVNIFSFANARRLRINQEGDAPNVPSAANESGQVGEIRWDANHIYIYVAANTWKRVALSTF